MYAFHCPISNLLYITNEQWRIRGSIMRNAKLYFIFTVILYITLIIWGIKGPAPNDVWEYEWVFQILAFYLLGLFNLIMVRVYLKEDPVHRKIITRLLLLYPFISFVTILIVVGI